MQLKNHAEFSKIWSYWNGSTYSGGTGPNFYATTAIIAKIPYLHVPEFEQKDINRINLIPCTEYKEIIGSGNKIDISKQFERDIDVEIPFVIESELFIATGIKLKNSLFIAIRGTQKLYDWGVNLNFLRAKSESGMYHVGFYKAIIPLIEKIDESARSVQFHVQPKYYIVGHSLGGALASILNIHSSLKIQECVTFGMPRFGNKEAVKSNSNHFGFVNGCDIVPKVPPKIFGYADSSSILALSSPKAVRYSALIYAKNIITLRSITDHSIEKYIEEIIKCSNSEEKLNEFTKTIDLLKPAF